MSGPVRRQRVVHVVYSFGIGGLENVIVQLINRLPHDRFEHVVMALTSISNFKDRIQRSDVQFIELHKPPGHAVPLYPRIWKLFRQLKPDVVHTCNLAALEVVPLAWLAGVPLRIHAEHGWDAHDPDGSNVRYQRLRRLYKPYVSHYVAVSQDIHDYLGRAIGVPAGRRSLIPNGVDTDQFSPPKGRRLAVASCPFDPEEHQLIGTVGRLQTVKNQPLLVKAFVHLLRQHPAMAERARLVIVGEGPLRGEVESVLADSGFSSLVWLAGARGDVADVLRMFTVFVLPSQTEGTSCTLQEAMACGLPLIATAVGGNPDLLDGGAGELVPPDDVDALSQALYTVLVDANRRDAMAQHARERALQHYGIDTVVNGYARLFLPSMTRGRA